MPKHSFLSTDFFVNTSEKEAVEALVSLPNHLNNITFLKENLLLHSMRFLYEQPDKLLQHYIDVSILPLNDQYVRISLHGSYTNGKRINTDPDISHSLQQFEQSIYAALKNDFSSVQVNKKIKKSPKKLSFYFTSLFPSMFFSR